MKSATDISKAVLPQRKYPTSDNRGTAKGNVLCVRRFYGLPFISHFKIGELPEISRTGEARLYGTEFRSQCFQSLYPLGSYERIHCFFDNDRAGMEALQQIRMEYGRDLYIRDASQTYSGCKDLNEYLQKQAERNRQVQSAKGVRSQPPKKKNGFRL